VSEVFLFSGDSIIRGREAKVVRVIHAIYSKVCYFFIFLKQPMLVVSCSIIIFLLCLGSTTLLRSVGR